MKKMILAISLRQLDVLYLSVPDYTNQEWLTRPLFCSSTHASNHTHHCH